MISVAIPAFPDKPNHLTYQISPAKPGPLSYGSPTSPQGMCMIPSDLIDLKPELNPYTAPISDGLFDQAEGSAPTVREAQEPVADVPLAELSALELTTHLIAKICHDFISPTGAIVSGLDLLDDPQAQDMREDAINLIRASSKKMVTLVHFARIAFGAATSAKSFSGKDIRLILEDIYAGLRGKLDFGIDDAVIFTKPQARALINMGYILSQALPTGGNARLEAEFDDFELALSARATGPRARLKPEAIAGLSGHDAGDGLSGQWIQPFWLYRVVREAGGELDHTISHEQVTLRVALPLDAPEDLNSNLPALV